MLMSWCQNDDIIITVFWVQRVLTQEHTAGMWRLNRVSARFWEKLQHQTSGRDLISLRLVSGVWSMMSWTWKTDAFWDSPAGNLIPIKTLTEYIEKN